MKTSRKKLWTHFPGSAPGPLTISSGAPARIWHVIRTYDAGEWGGGVIEWGGGGVYNFTVIIQSKQWIYIIYNLFIIYITLFIIGITLLMIGIIIYTYISIIYK